MTDRLIEILEDWLAMPAKTGLADDLRCAAMEIQEELPAATSKMFADAAATLDINPATARRCWSFVKAQA